MGQADLIKQITNNKRSMFGLLVAALMVFSTFYAAIASAETFGDRSIVASTASKNAGAESVSYQIDFTPEENAGAIVLDFCANTPVLGQSCTAPDGMDLDAAEIVSGGATIASATANKIILTKSFTAATPETIVINKLTNPTTAFTDNVVFVRMVSYVDGTAAALYESDDPTNADLDPAGGGALIAPIDSGSVSMFFNTDVTVQGTVLETMTFCVSGADIAPNCSGASTPVLTLGEDQGGGLLALVPGTVSTGALHVQMNTNATGGAVVRLKSSVPCGGLMRLGSSECNIVAAGATNVVGNDNSAKFGVKLATATTAIGASNPIGTLIPYDADGGGAGVAFYDTTNYKLNWNDDDSVGVTSVFGDPILGTNDAPATNQNMALTFAASVGTSTPAGTYSTDLNLIAVGKF